MYGWGGTDAGSWDRGGYNYDPAAKKYLDSLARDASARGPRSYSARSAPSDLVDVKGKTIRSDSQNPIIIGVDVTGSMERWPAEIFDRLPLLYQTLVQYNPDIEISFSAIGDANSDNYPLQVAPFEKGVKLEDCVKALCPEGGGGGQISESYELFAYFMANKCKTPKATSPFLFIFGDEKFYNTIEPGQVKHYIGDSLQSSLESKDVFAKLTQSFNMYFLHKPYGGGGDSATDKMVVDHWAKAIGKQRIVELPSADRAVDICMGIIAKHWGHYDDFGKSLSARQSDSMANSVHKSLRHIPDGGATTSVLNAGGSSKKTSSLSDMYASAKRASKR